jgi:hypothetical protein
LGKAGYVGSSGAPIVWELWRDSAEKTEYAHHRRPGAFKFLEAGQIYELSEDKLVDNNWSAPSASGCGGGLSFLVDPIVNEQLGDMTAGHNTVILENTIYVSAAAAVKLNDDMG